MYICITQAGLAGDDAPSAVFPTLVGRPRYQVHIRTLIYIQYMYVHYAFMNYESYLRICMY